MRAWRWTTPRSLLWTRSGSSHNKVVRDSDQTFGLRKKVTGRKVLYATGSALTYNLFRDRFPLIYKEAYKQVKAYTDGANEDKWWKSALPAGGGFFRRGLMHLGRMHHAAGHSRDSCCACSFV